MHMKKKLVVLVLVLVLLFGITIPIFASTASVSSQLRFSINGTTATCKFKVTDPGKYINATMELWQGSTFITSWSGSGYSIVNLSETYTVLSGVTYTLKGYGTSGGVSFTAPDITKP